MQAKAWLGRLQALLIEMAVNRSRRTYLSAAIASVLLPSVALASQREETLADNVASTMRRSVNNVSPARLVFSTPQAGRQWMYAMSAQLSRFIPDARERETLLLNIQYEAKRAGLDVQLILGLVEVESIIDISSRLVVNQASLKLKQAPLRHIIDAFAQAVAAKNN